MLEKEELIRSAIQASDDIISACIKFACVGNYIDFGVVDNVDSNVLERIFEKAKSEELN